MRAKTADRPAVRMPSVSAQPQHTKREKDMFMNIVAAICAVIAIGTGIWGFWFEYSQNHRDDKENNNGHEDTSQTL